MSGAAALSIRDLSVTLGGARIIHEAHFDLMPGRFVVLVGPNGAGKTTLLRAIFGLVPARGSIMVRGRALAGLTRRERARAIAMLPQGHAVHWPLPARDIVALGRYPHGAADPSRLSAAHAAIVEAAMARTGTGDLADRIVQTLSGGERARIMLARVLAVQAPILLADEPTASLDPRHQIAVMEELRAEARRGALVVAVTHDLTLAARLADEIILMHKGRISLHGAPDVVLNPETLAEIYGILAITREIEGERLLLPWSLAP